MTELFSSFAISGYPSPLPWAGPPFSKFMDPPLSGAWLEFFFYIPYLRILAPAMHALSFFHPSCPRVQLSLKHFLLCSKSKMHALLISHVHHPSNDVH
jgi:hypothetical protein